MEARGRAGAWGRGVLVEDPCPELVLRGEAEMNRPPDGMSDGRATRGEPDIFALGGAGEGKRRRRCRWRSSEGDSLDFRNFRDSWLRIQFR